MWPFWTTSYTTYTPRELHNQAFDYVVVGGGTGGCVVASRLSKDPNVRVLLIERGPIVDTWLSKVPLLSVDFRAASSPTFKWNSASDALYPSGEHLVSGKVFGGTSKINAHVYTRAVPAEYNAWAAAGRKGWDWETVEPYFCRSETSLTHPHEVYRGSSGPWHNRKLPDIYFKLHRFLNAADSLGIPRVKDIHDPSITPYSAACLDVTVDHNGTRVSTFDAFLPPKITNARRNLYICPSAVVCRLELQSTSSGLKAVGVHFKLESAALSSGECFVSVEREVILCAGAIATPQILMLSGIGPGGYLQSLGMTVKKDLPGVGSSLQDHATVPLIYKIPRVDSLHALESSKLLATWEILKYVFFGRGLLLSPNPQVALFALSKLLDSNSSTDQSAEAANSHSPANIPDIEIVPMPFNAFDDRKLDEADGVSTVCCINLKPKSSGTVRLLSLDARDRPVCDLKYLTNAEDYVVFRKMLRLGLEIGRKCRKSGYPLRDFRVPQSESDEDLNEYIRANIRTTFHYSCTCRMAPLKDDGVVDDELRVHGIEGLRIADASVFPVIPSAHPQAPVVMVAERCADFIKESRS
ncbi:GMC oxidoreductase [Irpex rosettiformis]|uniref:GMC oxidoreductase n=1 Tax=Irpex rosettiformis TaxID=378272 RepID=A0ACB8UCJ6_9APHY|nr:GMC oxidoreductase [Irpex rosettiformis]